ncbi:MAG: DUF58 domain-containing protein [Verrucomicrobiae bacterium]|nr:DUF58 domain-containing protein [Verrucomicrobiae bacterium]
MRLVPERRLLFVVGAVLMPGAAAGAVLPWLTAVAATLSAAVTVAAVLDAIAGKRRLGGLKAELAPLIRLTQNRETSLPMRLHNASGRVRHLRLGLALPPEFQSKQEHLWIAAPAEPAGARLHWHCLPQKRGRYRLQAVYLEEQSPLRFWALRSTLPLNTELRVYPNLAEERRRLAAFFLNRGLTGVHVQRQVGRGREFEKLREYVPGDDYQDIHWKTTAKRARPITKVFQIERTQEVYVLVDSSRLSARRCGETSALERFVTAALLLALAAEKQGDLFGLLTYSDKVNRFVRAGRGKSHYGTCREVLYTLEPQPVAPDLQEVFVFLRSQLRRRALLVFLTSLDDPLLAETFVRKADLISRQHLVLVNMPRPAGIAPLFSGRPVSEPDQIYERLSGHILWHNLGELGETLRSRGVSFQLVEAETLCARLIAQYLNVKHRQLL